MLDENDVKIIKIPIENYISDNLFEALFCSVDYSLFFVRKNKIY